jgi:hypothetical protein
LDTTIQETSVGSFIERRKKVGGDGEDAGEEGASSTTPAGVDCSGVLIRWNAQKTFGVIIGYSDKRATSERQ